MELLCKYHTLKLTAPMSKLHNQYLTILINVSNY